MQLRTVLAATIWEARTLEAKEFLSNGIRISPGRKCRPLGLNKQSGMVEGSSFSVFGVWWSLCSAHKGMVITALRVAKISKNVVQLLPGGQPHERVGVRKTDHRQRHLALSFCAVHGHLSSW